MLNSNLIISEKNLAKVKPSLAISEGIFNNVGMMNIKVDEKYGFDNSNLKDIIIHKQNKITTIQLL